MIAHTRLSSLWGALALLAASCGTAEPSNTNTESKDAPASSSTEPTSGSGETPTCTGSGTVQASSKTNFKFSSTVKLPNLTKVAPKTELSFDWSALTTDFLTKPTDPAEDVMLVTVALWEITPDQFATQINDDTLGSPAVAAFVQTEGKLTDTKLFKMAPPAGPIPQEQMLSFFDIDVYPPGKNFYTLMVGSDLTPGVKTRMIGGFELSKDSKNTKVEITNDSTKLEYEVDFSKSQPTYVPTDKSDITVDWSGMETASTTESDPAKLNAAGLPFLKRSIKQVRIARYSKSESELKQKESILKIDDLADATFIGDVTSGSKINLSTLKDSSGASFKGIDSSHTWLLALVNTDSKNPAPWYLTFLKVCK